MIFQTEYSEPQTLVSESFLRSVKVVALGDFTSLGDPTPRSTKSPL